MSNLSSNQSARNPYPCRKCGKTVYWHRAQFGKNYPCDSATDRRAFHKCEPAQQSLVNAVDQRPEPNQYEMPFRSSKAPTPKPITPDYFEATLEQRVESLEKQVAALVRTVRAVESRQPITAEDVGF